MRTTRALVSEEPLAELIVLSVEPVPILHLSQQETGRITETNEPQSYFQNREAKDRSKHHRH
jgi:hypothetical protein